MQPDDGVIQPLGVIQTPDPLWTLECVCVCVAGFLRSFSGFTTLIDLKAKVCLGLNINFKVSQDTCMLISPFETLLFPPFLYQ